MSRGGDFAIHADPRVQNVAVLHFDLARNVHQDLGSNSVVIVKN
jgi:hypothetical protein